MVDREDLVRRFWHEVWDLGNVEFANEFYAPAYRENLEPNTPAAFAEAAASWRSTFADFRVDVEEVFAAGDRVVSRVRYRARQVAPLRVAPLPGRSIDISGIDVFEFDGDRVRQHWHEADHLEMYRQLGAELRPCAATGPPTARP